MTNTVAILVIVISCMTVGCSSDGPLPPPLTAQSAAALVTQKWSGDELNHFKVLLHSDTLIECGVNNELWKLGEVTDRSGRAWGTAYNLTEKGKKILFSIDLKESGRGHEIVLRGPYRFDITGILDGTAPANKRVKLHWQIDWDNAPAELKACLPRFELSGSETALFELSDEGWRFASYLKPADAAVPPQSASAGSR